MSTKFSQDQRNILMDRLEAARLTVSLAYEILRPGDFAERVVSFIRDEAEKAAAERLRTFVRPTDKRLRAALIEAGADPQWVNHP